MRVSDKKYAQKGSWNWALVHSTARDISSAAFYSGGGTPGGEHASLPNGEGRLIE